MKEKAARVFALVVLWPLAGSCAAPMERNILNGGKKQQIGHLLLCRFERFAADEDTKHDRGVCLAVVCQRRRRRRRPLARCADQSRGAGRKFPFRRNSRTLARPLDATLSSAAGCAHNLLLAAIPAPSRYQIPAGQFN